MRNENLTIVIGNLGNTPTLRKTKEGTAVTNFNVATNTPTTTWFKVVAWGANAEFCTSTLQKGDKVYIKGHMENKTHKKGGTIIKEMQLIATNIMMFSLPSKQHAEIIDWDE